MYRMRYPCIAFATFSRVEFMEKRKTTVLCPLYTHVLYAGAYDVVVIVICGIRVKRPKVVGK